MFETLTRRWLAVGLLLLILGAAMAVPWPSAQAGTSWTVEVVDGRNDTGRFPSLALRPDGWPAVAYFSRDPDGGFVVRYAWRDGGGWHNTTVDKRLGSAMGWGISLAVDAVGLPHITYLSMDASADQTVWYARWNISSASWDYEAVGDAGTSLEYLPSAIALNSTGGPVVAYVNAGTLDLVLATREAGAWVPDVVDSIGPIATASPLSLKLDAQDRPHIAYFRATFGSSGELRHAHHDGVQWLVDIVDSTGLWAGWYPSLALDALGRPRIAYVGADTTSYLRYASWTGGAWNITDVVSAGYPEGASLALNATGAPRISFIDHPYEDLKFASWDGSAWTVQLVDPDTAIWHTSLAVDASDTAHIAYSHYGPNGLEPQLRYASGVRVNDPPSSAVVPVTPYWRNVPTPASATASDPDGTVASVDLYYRFDGGFGWGPWTVYATETAAPWSWAFPFPDGDGYYEFHSRAYDGTDFEAAKTAAEATAGYDATPPASSVDPVSPYWRDSGPLLLTANAADALSGVASVALRYRFAADNLTWGPWTPLGTDTAAPWSTSFPFPDGPGFYEFHALAADIAGNAEGAKTVAEARAALLAPLLPPREVTTVWDGSDGISLSWVEPPTPADRYLVYRAADPTGFADLSPAAAYATVPASATAWADPEPFTATGERYYVMRWQADLPLPRASATSNTAGVFAGALNAGLTAISRPLEYFPWVDYSGPEWNTVEEYRTAFAAARIEYLEAGTWQRVFGGGDPNMLLEVGKAYVVARANPGRFVFTGLPGAQLLYTDAPGFDPATDARDLQVSIFGDDILLAFPQPPAVTPGVDAYEVLVATSRAGFFDGSAALLGGAPILSGPGPMMTLTDVGAILRSPELYYMVVPVTAAGVGASTYSVGVFTRTLQGADTLALPLRPPSAESVDSLADAIPNALGLLYLGGGAWVPHFRGMPAGVYDAAVVLGAGYQITVATVSRYSFVGS